MMSEGLDGASLIALKFALVIVRFPHSVILVLLGASFDGIVLRKYSNLERGRSDREAIGQTGVG